MCVCVCVCQTRKQMHQVLTECRGLAREGRTPASWGTYSRCCPWKSGRGDRQCYSDPHTLHSFRKHNWGTCSGLKKTNAGVTVRKT